MRKVFRFQNNNDYWDKRWVESSSDLGAFHDLSIYPIRFAEMLKPNKDELIGELGCGLGRVIKHYHFLGYKIIGLERSKIAVEQIKKDESSLNIIQGDVCNLPFSDDYFDVILCFGVFHNIENNMVKGLIETNRCLKEGGRFCISMRPDNFEMRLNEVYWGFKNQHKKKDRKYFHKWLVKEKEFKLLLNDYGFEVHNIYRAQNVSILWRVPFLRKKDNRNNNHEKEYRSSGYQLNKIGKIILSILKIMFPSSFCNVLVYTGVKYKA